MTLPFSVLISRLKVFFEIRRILSSLITIDEIKLKSHDKKNEATRYSK